MKIRKCDQDQQLAERYASSTRTVRRWRSKGIDLTNPLAIAEFIISSKSATPAQLAACNAVIASIESQAIESKP